MIFMEIKNVLYEVKNEYPKMEQVSKKHLSNSIPRKWLKVGLSSLGIAAIMRKNIFAKGISVDMIDMHLAGDMPVHIVTPLPVQICNSVCPIVQIGSAIVFIITSLSILITKIKEKKHTESKKIKNWIKVLFIISIIVFIISFITKIVINTIYSLT